MSLSCHGCVNVPNTVHYLTESAKEEKLPNGVLLHRWDPEADPIDDFTLSPPHGLRISVPAGKAFPADGSPYWLNRQAAYVVVKGEALIGNDTLVPGDMFYAGAGVVHGPVACHGTDDLVVTAVSTKAFEMHTSAPPHGLPANAIWSMPGVGIHRGEKGNWYVDPSVPVTEQCAAGGVEAAFWLRDEMVPGSMMVRLAENCVIPFHYHPEGVLYFFVEGEMAVANDFGPENVTFRPGDMRWARPGFAYGPEFAMSKALLAVLGAPPRMVFSARPEGEVLAVRKNVTLQVVYDNPQAPSLAASAATVRRPRRASRSFLRRRRESDGDDETAAMQLWSGPSEWLGEDEDVEGEEGGLAKPQQEEL